MWAMSNCTKDLKWMTSVHWLNKKLKRKSFFEIRQYKTHCFISHLIYPLTAMVTGTPQMISQPVSTIFPCSPLPSGTSRIPSQSIPRCWLPTSSSVCLVFFLLSLCLARRFWPDLMNGKHNHTLQFASLYDRQEVFVWSNCLLDLGTDFLVGNMVFVWDV